MSAAWDGQLASDLLWNQICTARIGMPSCSAISLRAAAVGFGVSAAAVSRRRAEGQAVCTHLGTCLLAP